MQTTYFERFVQQHLPMSERSAFGELSVLPYSGRKSDKIHLSDFNNLSNFQILNIIKTTSVSLNYQYFSISIFQIDNENKFSFFTQKVKGKRSSLSQVFLNDRPVLILETCFLSHIEYLIEDYKKNHIDSFSDLINLISDYEYR